MTIYYKMNQPWIYCEECRQSTSGYCWRHSSQQISHFQCGKCSKWWSIGDAPTDRQKWYCPWCSQENWFING